ncbi:hypothetical protein V1525DRAFT_411403 [Lipomyces kononenkoae]|uniref:Uncharacterized protein n=1 Tax=Lipomyces kononenkoae TaxID=34357 RepID=A0ACC3STL7_LIPKO
MSSSTRQATTNLTTDQLLDTFCNPSLTPHAYLNAALPSYKHPTALPQIHTEAVGLLSSLDHATQELIAKLERVVTDMLSSANRLNYEVELLAGDVEQLDTSITNDLKPQVDNIAHKSPAMQRLEMLELVRRRLVEVLDAFKEAKRIDADLRSGGAETEENIREMLAQGKFKLANDEVERLGKIIEVWKGTHEFASKSDFVGKLRKLVHDTVTRSEGGGTSSIRSTGLDSEASTPATGRSPAPPSVSTFEKHQDYPSVRASAEFLRHEAREGYLGLIESLKKIRQA